MSARAQNKINRYPHHIQADHRPHILAGTDTAADNPAEPPPSTPAAPADRPAGTVYVYRYITTLALVITKNISSIKLK